jgi:hypothetical protein
MKDWLVKSVKINFNFWEHFRSAFLHGRIVDAWQLIKVFFGYQETVSRLPFSLSLPLKKSQHMLPFDAVSNSSTHDSPGIFIDSRLIRPRKSVKIINNTRPSQCCVYNLKLLSPRMEMAQITTTINLKLPSRRSSPANQFFGGEFIILAEMRFKLHGENLLSLNLS